MAVPPILEFLIYMTAVLLVFMFIVTASGHFPAEHRKDALKGRKGTAILIFTSSIVAGTMLITLVFAYQTIPWYAAVIGGGAMILAAPYLLHPWSDKTINSATSLLLMSLGAIALGSTMLAWM